MLEVKNMKFNPGFVIGEVVSNREVSKAFGCAIMGGMRPSTKAGTLEIGRASCRERVCAYV